MKMEDLENALFDVSWPLGEGSTPGGRFVTPRLQNESAPSVIESLVAVGRWIDSGRSAAAAAASSSSAAAASTTAAGVAAAAKWRHRRADVVLGPEAGRHSERSARPHSVAVP